MKPDVVHSVWTSPMVSGASPLIGVTGAPPPRRRIGSGANAPIVSLGHSPGVSLLRAAPETKSKQSCFGCRTKSSRGQGELASIWTLGRADAGPRSSTPCKRKRTTSVRRVISSFPGNKSLCRVCPHFYFLSFMVKHLRCKYLTIKFPKNAGRSHAGSHSGRG